jgi:4-carboxymuconolactone decarboxylase
MSTQPSLGRFTEIEREQMSPQQEVALKQLLGGARGSVPTPYKIWLSSPELVRHLEGLGTFLLRESSLTARENEIAILTVARHLDCAFVVAAHSRVGKRVGLEDHVISALSQRHPPDLTDIREQVVYDVARALPAGPPDDELYQRAVVHLEQRGIADLTALLGYYTAVSYILNFHDVPVPNWDAAPGGS